MKKALLLLALFQQLLIAQKSEPFVNQALKITTPIILDGKLSESVWQDAIHITNFTQRELNEGAPPTERTEVAFLYDENNLYIGVWAYDSEPDKISASKMKRDFFLGSDDNFEIIISPFDDKRNGYLFVTNPNGALADVLITDEGRGFNKSWNGIWDVVASISDEGWFAEIEIPFSTFKYPDMEKQVWGLNMERNIRRKREQLLWQGWSRDYELETISNAGKLIISEKINAEKVLELKPFISGGIAKETENSVKDKIKVGGDINYLFSPTMKLNLTINTDFSQVEADQLRINLTRFSLFFPEKREFFLEGKNVFEMNLGYSTRIFYTRRIGIHEGDEVPIIGGARLLGKTGNTHIGFISIQTEAHESLPTTNYTVLRFKQDVLEQSNIGVIFTAKNNSEGYNYVYGAEGIYTTSRLFGNKSLSISGEFTQSFTKDTIQSNDIGYRLFVNYPNDFIEWNAGTVSISDNYDPQIGFLRRKNYNMYTTEFKIKPRPEFISWIQQLEFKPIEIDYYNTKSTNKMESVFTEFRPLGFTTTSGESFEFNIQKLFDRLDKDFEIIDENIISAGSYWDTRYEIQFDTYRGRTFAVGGGVNWGKFYSGTRNRYELNARWFVSRHLNFNLIWEKNDVSLPGGKFTADEIGGRVAYSFNPKLYTSVFAQWNNEDNIIVINYRINWIPKIGSFFYFVINQDVSTAAGKLRTESFTILGKLIWLFSF